jgi:DtxR family manganese transport transcriptional regulator
MGRSENSDSAVAHSALKRLNGMGLIVYERYRELTLTDKGEEMAWFIQEKHVTIVRFLRILGIEEKTARLDAEGIEHHVHKVTLNRIDHFQFRKQTPLTVQDVPRYRITCP